MTRAKDISKIVTDADLSGTLDVTGTITVGDGHTIGDDGSDNLEIATSVGENLILASSGNVNTFLDTNEDQSTASFQIHSGTTSSTHKLLRVEETGDISFYEDTGTTPKLFWDASAESLTIGTATITPNGASDDLVIAKSGSTGLNFISGTSDAQTIAFGDTSDSLVGSLQYFHSDDHMEFTVNNAEAMRINSNGNVLIGRTSELTDFGDGRTSLVLQGTGSQDYATIQIGNNGTASNTQILGILAFYDGVNNNARVQAQRNDATDSADLLFSTRANGGSLTERMRIDSSGRVMIGTTTEGSANEAEELTIAGTGGVGMTIRSTDSGTSRIYFSDGTSGTPEYAGYQIYNHSSNAMIFGTNAIERMRIDTSGNLLVGRTDNPSGISNGIYVTGAYTYTTGSSANMFINSEGRMMRSTSSLRYKNTINDATHGLTELLTLRPVTYKGNNDGDTIYGGLIAEEVHDAGLTEFVQYNDDDEPDALAYGNMVSLCIKAIQELKAELDSAKARITALENGE